MHIDVITVPYHLGHPRIGMGNGPDELIRAGLIEMLVSHGHQTELRKVTLQGRAANEIDGSFALQHLVAEQVAAAERRDALPVTLAGNCNYAAVGTVGGLNHDVGVVWFDAHSDFATTGDYRIRLPRWHGHVDAHGRMLGGTAQAHHGFTSDS